MASIDRYRRCYSRVSSLSPISNRFANYIYIYMEIERDRYMYVFACHSCVSTVNTQLPSPNSNCISHRGILQCWICPWLTLELEWKKRKFFPAFQIKLSGTIFGFAFYHFPRFLTVFFTFSLIPIIFTEIFIILGVFYQICLFLVFFFNKNCLDFFYFFKLKFFSS